MKNTTIPHKVLASVLVVVLLLLSTAGFGLAISLSLKEQAPSKHVSCGCITADDDGGKSGCPTSEASHGDFNPSCDATPAMPIYAPLVENLRAYEPFRAPPQVYFEFFVPPKNRC